MEDSLRSFVEECDWLQVCTFPSENFRTSLKNATTSFRKGIQLTHDTSTFGSFVDSFLTSFRDEFPKLSVMSFPLLSNLIPGSIDVDDVSRYSLVE